MKVLVINLDKAIFSPGSRSLERLREYAAFCEKLSVVVLTLKPFEPIIDGNMAVYATASRSKFGYLLDALRLAKKIINDGGADLVMTQDAFDTGHIGWLIKKRFHLAWQCQVHTDFLSPYFWRESFVNKVRVLAAKFLLPAADGCRVVSQRIKVSLVKIGYPAEAIKVLPIFVDTAGLKSSPVRIDLKKKYPQFDFLILMASRLTREKNIGLAIRAMADLIKDRPGAGLLIVGDGAEKEKLKTLIADRGLEANIILEPWNDDLASYYKTADFFLLTSNYEGWGMTIVEGMACGCPVVMTDVGCAGELVKNNENGLIVPVGDQAGLTAALRALAGNNQRRQALAAGAAASVATLPSVARNLELYKESFEQTISNFKRHHA